MAPCIGVCGWWVQVVAERCRAGARFRGAVEWPFLLGCVRLDVYGLLTNVRCIRSCIAPSWRIGVYTISREMLCCQPATTNRLRSRYTSPPTFSTHLPTTNKSSNNSSNSSNSSNNRTRTRASRVLRALRALPALRALRVRAVSRRYER